MKYDFIEYRLNHSIEGYSAIEYIHIVVDVLFGDDGIVSLMDVYYSSAV